MSLLGRWVPWRLPGSNILYIKQRDTSRLAQRLFSTMPLRHLQLLRLLFTNGPCKSPRFSTSSHHESLRLQSPSTQDGLATNDERILPKSSAFPLEKLPVELQGLVVDHLVLLYLEHPSRVCWKLPRILELRIVSRTTLPCHPQDKSF